MISSAATATVDPIDAAFEAVHGDLAAPVTGAHLEFDFIDNLDLVLPPRYPASPVSSESEAVADTESSGLGDDVPPVGPVADSDADRSDVDSDGEVPVVCRESPLFVRDGNKILWDGAVIGSLTAWGRNLSCRCRLPGHRNCKTPASTKFPSDNVLIDWLLSGLADGVDKD